MANATAAKASNPYRAKLLELHAALKAANDDERIDELQEELDRLRESEKPELDDGVDVAAAARKLAPQALKLLKTTQLLSYLRGVGEGAVDRSLGPGGEGPGGVTRLAGP